MKNSTLYAVYPQDEAQVEALKTFMESRNIPFEAVDEVKEEEGLVNAIEEGMKTENIHKNEILKVLGK